MSKLAFQVNLNPADAYQKVRDEQDADLVHEEFHDLGEGRCLGTLIFERYYFRTKNRAALVVLVDNLQGVTQGVTEVRAIATGSSEGLFFNIDWGASENFVRSVERILRDFIR